MSITVPKDIWKQILTYLDLDLCHIKPCEWVVVNGTAYNLNHVYKVQWYNNDIQLWIGHSDHCRKWITLQKSDPRFEQILKTLGVFGFIDKLNN